MLCSLCKTEMRITRAYNRVENDNTPEKQTKLYRVLVHTCVNPKCSERGKEVEISHEEALS